LSSFNLFKIYYNYPLVSIIYKTFEAKIQA